MKAKVLEIFSSMQGEGLFVGAKQIFVRFAGCNLDCAYCDTEVFGKTEQLTCDAVMQRVVNLDRTGGAHHSVSITGGEPLLHTEFLSELLPKLKGRGFKIYLETNGTLPDKLGDIIDDIDIIAMDIKMPSSSETEPLWKAHGEFIRIALAKGRSIFIKAVVTGDTEMADLIQAAELVAEQDRTIPFIVQPVTPTSRCGKTVPREKIRKYSSFAENRLQHVRVMPQMHKHLNIK